MTTLYKFKAYYTDAGVGTAQDPAPTCTVINMADDSKLADAQATTASTNMPGLYSYEYSGNDGLDCVAWFKTTDTGCDVKELASYVSEKITTILSSMADITDITVPLATVDANVDAILADTGTDGVKVAAGAIDAAAIADNAIDAGAIATGAITNAKFAAGAIDAAAIATDAIDADSVKADAVTEIQSGLALEATLTAIKGAGWTNETLVKIVTDIAAISAGSGATAQEVWEYATRVLTAGTNIDLSSLATASALTATGNAVITIDNNVETLYNDLVNGGRLDLLIDAIKAKTDNLPADPADDSDIDTAIAAVKSVVDAIKTETDGHPTVAEVWSYGTRTLTTAVAGAVIPATGDTLEITKDSTVIINLTGLGDIHEYTASTSGQEDKVWFTAKKSLDDTDASSIIQIFTLYPAGNTPPDTLTYINGVAATATEGTFQFTDLVAGNATITLAAAAAADLPIYAVSPLYWDVKILKYSTGVVSILASGEMYIYGTPTISIS